MTFLIADRVRESSVTTGTGNITLGGAVVGYQTFDAVLNTGDTTFYVFADQAGGPNWEVGIGTFTAPSTLARTTILSSSNSGNIVNFGAGTKDVFISLPASETNAFATGPDIAPSLLLDFANLKELDPRITFTRASTATYYDGKTWAKAEENLLQQSQDFTTTWTAGNLSVTANSAVAPDGTSTAETLNDGVATGTHALLQIIPALTVGSTYVLSAFFKNVDRQFVTLAASSGTVQWAAAKFDLSAGTAGSVTALGAGWSAVSSSITSVGNNWYRCVLVFIPGATAVTPRIGLATDGTTFTASERGLESYTGSNKSVEVWGAQLEQRSAVTAYTPTTTQPVTNYIPALQTAASGVARFDHNPVTVESLGLLIEEQRTNQLLRSEEFDDAYWVKADATITANTIVAPDGTLTGDALVSSINGGSNTCFVNKQTGVAASTNYTYSVFIKKGTSPTTTLNFYRASPFSQVFGTINWSTETMSVSGAILLASSFIPVGNGWYRASLTINSDTATSLVWRVYVRDQGTSNVAGEYVFIWGAQLEAGAFPTSYIKTEASQVTRSADAASMTGTNFSSWYRQDEGTIFAITQLTGYSSTSNPSLVTIANSASISNNNINMFVAGASGNYRSSIVESGVGTFLQNVTTVTNIYDVVPWSIAYKTNDAYSVSRYFIGNPTDTSVTIPTTVNTLYIDASSSVRKYIRKVAFYPKRLSNAQLQALTR